MHGMGSVLVHVQARAPMCVLGHVQAHVRAEMLG